MVTINDVDNNQAVFVKLIEFIDLVFEAKLTIHGQIVYSYIVQCMYYNLNWRSYESIKYIMEKGHIVYIDTIEVVYSQIMPDLLHGADLICLGSDDIAVYLDYVRNVDISLDTYVDLLTFDGENIILAQYDEESEGLPNQAIDFIMERIVMSKTINVLKHIDLSVARSTEFISAGFIVSGMFHSLGEVQITSIGNLGACSICYEDLCATMEGKTKCAIRLACGHWYHNKCIYMWVNFKDTDIITCPMCRRVFERHVLLDLLECPQLIKYLDE